MQVYRINFGRHNVNWPECLEKNVLHTFMEEGGFHYYQNNDRQGWNDYAMANLKTIENLPPTRPVASRWYTAMETVSSTEGDIWLHRDGNYLWWTISKSAPADIYLQGSEYICAKPCEPWSNRSRDGKPLLWEAIHDKAKYFLSFRDTLSKLSADNASYAMALINGDDLSDWHSRSEWKEKIAKTGRNPVTLFDARQKSVVTMRMTAFKTVKNANGQSVQTTLKNKEMRYTEDELDTYLETLLDSQEGLCAISGIPLQYYGEADDPEMLCSLDRMDSDGHYEAGNLQIVCRFINRWKSDDKDTEFRRLLEAVRAA